MFFIWWAISVELIIVWVVGGYNLFHLQSIHLQWADSTLWNARLYTLSLCCEAEQPESRTSSKAVWIPNSSGYHTDFCHVNFIISPITTVYQEEYHELSIYILRLLRISCIKRLVQQSQDSNWNAPKPSQNEHHIFPFHSNDFPLRCLNKRF